VLKTADIIKNEFLQQNAFHPKDFTCPLWKTAGMMRCIVRFYEKAMATIKDSEKSERKISMGFIEQTLKGEGQVMYDLTQIKFTHPTDTSEEEGRKIFDDLVQKIDDSFRQLTL